MFNFISTCLSFILYKCLQCCIECLNCTKAQMIWGPRAAMQKQRSSTDRLLSVNEPSTLTSARNPFTEWRDSGYALPGGIGGQWPWFNGGKWIIMNPKMSNFTKVQLQGLILGVCVSQEWRALGKNLRRFHFRMFWMLTVQFEGLDDRDRTYSGLPFLIRWHDFLNLWEVDSDDWRFLARIFTRRRLAVWHARSTWWKGEVQTLDIVNWYHSCSWTCDIMLP